MKNLLTILSISLLASTANAEDTATTKFGAVLEPIKAESSNVPELVISQYEQSEQKDSNLWEILDTDKNGFISKTEAASSTKIVDKWESLDSNKDEQLDTAEFSQLFSQTN